MVTGPHSPARPGWDCAACGEPWPCDPAREHLAVAYGRTHLAIVMVDQLGAAAVDMPAARPAELYERFIAWTRAATAGS
jgi:hypothetical protein